MQALGLAVLIVALLLGLSAVCYCACVGFACLVEELRRRGDRARAVVHADDDNPNMD